MEPTNAWSEQAAWPVRDSATAVGAPESLNKAFSGVKMHRTGVGAVEAGHHAELPGNADTGRAVGALEARAPNAKVVPLGPLHPFTLWSAVLQQHGGLLKVG